MICKYSIVYKIRKVYPTQNKVFKNKFKQMIINWQGVQYCTELKTPFNTCRHQNMIT